MFGVAWPLRKEHMQKVRSQHPACGEAEAGAAGLAGALIQCYGIALLVDSTECKGTKKFNVQRSAEDIEVARARAAKDLVNIDSDERRRRVIFGSIVTVCPLSGIFACTALVSACMRSSHDIHAAAASKRQQYLL